MNRARKEGESYESYRAALRRAEKLLRLYLRGRPAKVMGRTTPKRDKQRRKRERAETRRRAGGERGVLRAVELAERFRRAMVELA